MALGLDDAAPAVPASTRGRARAQTDRLLIDACRATPARSRTLAAASVATLTEAALAVARLEHDGGFANTAGWFEAVDDWADLA